MTMQPPPLNWLATFRTVIEAGSFANAAKVLNVTPSAVSHQMRDLEARLGIRLFVRANRTVIPTDAALDYHRGLQEGFDKIAAATRRLGVGEGTRRLAIHSSPSFATLWLMPRLGAFMRDHGTIDVTLSSSNEPVRLGPQGFDIDIQHARPVPDDCDGLLIAEELVAPLASPRLLTDYRLETAADIAKTPLIHSLRCMAQWDHWLARHSAGVATPTRGMRFDRSFLALAAAVDGLGLALESTLLARDMIRDGRLVMPFGPAGVTVRAHRLVHLKSERGDATVQAFVAWIRQQISTP